MDISKANEISKLVNMINKSQEFINKLDIGYQDEFYIYYNNDRRCNLEKPVLHLIKKILSRSDR